MIVRFSLAFAAALALVTPASAQSMPGMQMPPAQPSPPPQHRHAPTHHAPATSQTQHPAQTEPAQAQPPPQEQPQHDNMQGMQMQPGETMPGMQHGDTEEITFMDARMYGALGHYSMMREASGTSWQPDAVGGMGAMHASSDGMWMLMGHALINGVYDWQEGPRGGDKAFVSGMIMGSAQRYVGEHGTINLRAMLAPDPLMGASGYPEIFQAGETANGVTPLVDRQHPHDLFMELAGSYSYRLADNGSVFVYAGLPGEPAFGPPAFMHRLSAMDSPEAPLTHHWLDSTHVTFGVITAGYVHDDWKIEASGFRGREPDEHRYDIESPRIDSSAVRLSWNPSRNWALQVSWADLHSPEQLEPALDETRWSASAIYSRPIGEDGWWSATAAFGRKERSDGVDLDGFLLEGAVHPNEAWTFFGRGERLETDELIAGPAHTVHRISAGAIRDWRVSDHATIGVGALIEHDFAPDALEPSYDGDPNGAMGFVRLKVE